MKRILLIIGAAFGAFVLLICVLGLIFGKAPDRTTAPTTQVVAAAAPTTVEVDPTDVPTAEPTPAPPTATLSAEQHYLTVAKDAAPPLVRGDLPKGNWEVKQDIAAEGPSVRVTMPLNVAFNKEQFVRQAKRSMALVTKALFDADPQLERVNVIGTMADGKDQSELPALSIVVLRPEYAKWDGLPENLTHWNVSQRYK